MEVEFGELVFFEELELCDHRANEQIKGGGPLDWHSDFAWPTLGALWAFSAPSPPRLAPGCLNCHDFREDRTVWRDNSFAEGEDFDIP